MMMEYEDKISIIDGLISILSSKHFEDLCEHQLISDLYSIRNIIGKLDSSSISVIDFISNVITDDFYIIYSELRKLTEGIEFGDKETDSYKLTLRRRLEDLRNKITRIKSMLLDYTTNRTTVYNSEDYYRSQILEIQKQKKELEEALNIIQKEKRNIQGKNQAEKELHEKKYRKRSFNCK